jgi:hypothetical protein
MGYCPDFKSILTKPPQKWKDRIREQRQELEVFYKLTKINKSISREVMLKIIPKLKPKGYSKTLFQTLKLRNLKALDAMFKSSRLSSGKNEILSML